MGHRVIEVVGGTRVVVIRVHAVGLDQGLGSLVVGKVHPDDLVATGGSTLSRAQVELVASAAGVPL